MMPALVARRTFLIGAAATIAMPLSHATVSKLGKYDLWSDEHIFSQNVVITKDTILSMSYFENCCLRIEPDAGRVLYRILYCSLWGCSFVGSRETWEPLIHESFMHNCTFDASECQVPIS